MKDESILLSYHATTDAHLIINIIYSFIWFYIMQSRLATVLMIICFADIFAAMPKYTDFMCNTQ